MCCKTYNNKVLPSALCRPVPLLRLVQLGLAAPLCQQILTPCCHGPLLSTLTVQALCLGSLQSLHNAGIVALPPGLE